MAVRVSADELRSLGTAVSSRTTAIASLWTGLSGCYQAPEQEKVLSVMAPAQTAGEDVATAAGQAAAALDAYADELDPIRTDMLDLERRAREFRNRVKDGVKTNIIGEVPFYLSGPAVWAVQAVTSDWKTVPWSEHGPSCTENTKLLNEYAALWGRVSQAVGTCADAVNRVAYPMVCMTPTPVFTAEDVMAAGDMGWGYAREEDRNCVEQVYQGEADFFGGIATGAGMLVLGYNPETGGFFEGSAYGQAWGGLGDLVGSALVVANPVGALVNGTRPAREWIEDKTGWNVSGGAVDDWMSDRQKVLTDAGGSLIGYDPAAADAGGDGWHMWKDEPWRAGTSSTLNVGTFFIPVAGEVGGAAKAGSLGAKAGTWASASARLAGEVVLPGGSWLVRGGELAAHGAGALVRTGEWSAALDTVRLASSGARPGLGGVTNGVAQALADLDKMTPPVHMHPDVPNVSESVSLTSTAEAPRVSLDDKTVHAAMDSWLHQDAPILEPSAAQRAAGAEVTAPQPVHATAGAAAQPVHVTAGAAAQPVHVTAGAAAQPVHVTAGAAGQPVHVTAGAAGQPVHVTTGAAAQPVHSTTGAAQTRLGPGAGVDAPGIGHAAEGPAGRGVGAGEQPLGEPRGAAPGEHAGGRDDGAGDTPQGSTAAMAPGTAPKGLADGVATEGSPSGPGGIGGETPGGRDTLGSGGDSPPGRPASFDVDDPSTWPFDLTDPAKVYEHAFHNMHSDTVVLGRFEAGSPNSYQAVAQSHGYAYFELGNEGGIDLWRAVEEANGFGGRDMFDAVNAPFLDDVMFERKTIIFSHDPLSAPDGSYLAQEFRYIFDDGPFNGTYRWDPTIGPHGAAVPL